MDEIQKKIEQIKFYVNNSDKDIAFKSMQIVLNKLIESAGNLELLTYLYNELIDTES